MSQPSTSGAGPQQSNGSNRDSQPRSAPRGAASGPLGASSGYRTPSHARSGGESSFGGRTPVTVRGDLGMPIRRRSDNFAALGELGTPENFGPGRDAAGGAAPEGDADGGQPGAADGPPTLIWGTNTDIRTVERKFYRFLTQYDLQEVTDEMTGDTQRLSKYLRVTKEAVEKGEGAVCIDCSELNEFDPVLYGLVVAFPREVIPLMDPLVGDAALQLALHAGLVQGPDDPAVPALQVRLFNLIASSTIRDLNPGDMDRLVGVAGMVTRTSAVIPDLQEALFQCEACRAEVLAPNAMGSIQEPTKCPSCQQKFSFRLVHNRSSYLNKQLIKVQEAPDNIPEGETPHSVSMFAYDDLVDFGKPGDRITVTAIYRAAPIRPNPKQRTVKSVYKTYLDIIHIQREEKSQLFSVAEGPAPAAGEDTLLVDADVAAAAGESQPNMHGADHFLAGSLRSREERMLELSRHPAVYERLVRSFAPSIFGMDDVKKGLLCQLFGATSKEWAGGKVRGEINVLLVGDPGVSKSQLLHYSHKIAPRGIYTSGRGSSAVGLTAYVTRDPESREMVLESGALVLSDRGVCCIDEFDKMSDNARSMLHEVMEQQTVSVAKAGIISSLNARTSVLAGANPVKSKYDQKLTITDNINLPPSLMSRFDLIYVLLDKADQAKDLRLAQFLVALYRKDPPESQLGADFIPQPLMRDYITYARSQVHPRMSATAAELVVQEYLEMRQAGRGRGVISATPRQLESLIRLSESLARMRLSSEVTDADVKEAARLMRDSLRQSLHDDRLGVADMGMLTEGGGASARAEMEALQGEVLKVVEAATGKVQLWRLRKTLVDESTEATRHKITDDLLRKVLTEMDASGQLRYNTGDGTVQQNA